MYLFPHKKSIKNGKITLTNLLCFEINPRYWADIADMLSALGFTDVEVGKDAFGHERFVIGRRRKDDLTTDKDRPGQGGNN